MIFLKDIIRSLYILFVILIVTSTPAYAYIDPGAASYIIQVILAALLAVCLIFKSFFIKIIRLFKKKKDADE